MPHKSATQSYFDYYYNSLKVVENGSILAYKIKNIKNIKDLNLIVSKLKNLNYNLVSLDTLIKE